MAITQRCLVDASSWEGLCEVKLKLWETFRWMGHWGLKNINWHANHESQAWHRQKIRAVWRAQAFCDEELSNDKWMLHQWRCSRSHFWPCLQPSGCDRAKRRELRLSEACYRQVKKPVGSRALQWTIPRWRSPVDRCLEDASWPQASKWWNILDGVWHLSKILL